MERAFWTVKEVSTYLSIKEKTIYSWLGKGGIPYYQIQGSIRFKKSEIDQWLEQCSNTNNDLVQDRVKAIENDLSL